MENMPSGGYGEQYGEYAFLGVGGMENSMENMPWGGVRG